jgi:DNA-binding HxlR family transcriptional regulator
MVKRVGFGKAACPVARALDVIGDWWSLLIIRDAFEGVRRFSEFQAGLAASWRPRRLRTGAPTANTF